MMSKLKNCDTSDESMAGYNNNNKNNGRNAKK